MNSVIMVYVILQPGFEAGVIGRNVINLRDELSPMSQLVLPPGGRFSLFVRRDQMVRARGDAAEIVFIGKVIWDGQKQNPAFFQDPEPLHERADRIFNVLEDVVGDYEI